MMKRILTGVALCAAFACRGAAQEQVPEDPIATALGSLRVGQLDAALVQAEDISNPAAKLFVQACVEQARGDFERALETVTLGIVQYPHDPDWTAKSELMSAALYIQMGMPDAAETTVRQMQLLYQGTEIANQAASLRSRIEKLRAEKESEGSVR